MEPVIHIFLQNQVNEKTLLLIVNYSQYNNNKIKEKKKETKIEAENEIAENEFYCYVNNVHE